MYSHLACAEPGCGAPAVAGFPTCPAHAADPAALLAALSARLEAESVHRDLVLAGLRLEGLDLSGKTFICCSFVGSELRNIRFTGASLRTAFFDRASISACDFSRLDAQFSSFGAARLEDCSFENSELLHVNFCGASLRECSFNNSNLYDSRFIGTELVRTDFVDCDLKRVHLIPAAEVEVSYKYSNTMEAIRDLEHLYQ